MLPAAGGAYRLAHHAAGCVPQRALARGAGGAGRRGGRGRRVLACAAAGPAAAAWNQQGCNTSCVRFASSPIWRCLAILSGVELFARECIWMYAWANLCTPVTAMSLCPPLTALPATPPPAPVLEVQRACHWSTAGRACGHARLPHRHAGGLVSCTLLCLYSCDVVSRCCCGQECGVSAAACRCPYVSGWAAVQAAAVGMEVPAGVCSQCRGAGVAQCTQGCAPARSPTARLPLGLPGLPLHACSGRRAHPGRTLKSWRAGLPRWRWLQAQCRP